jgi:hypothetical protein
MHKQQRVKSSHSNKKLKKRQFKLIKFLMIKSRDLIVKIKINIKDQLSI